MIYKKYLDNLSLLVHLSNIDTVQFSRNNDIARLHLIKHVLLEILKEFIRDSIFRSKNCWLKHPSSFSMHKRVFGEKSVENQINSSVLNFKFSRTNRLKLSLCLFSEHVRILQHLLLTVHCFSHPKYSTILH